MAAVRVSAFLVEDLLFGMTDKPVRIAGAVFDGRDLVFDIEGEDVPEGAGEVSAIVHEQSNRAGDRLRRMTFQRV